MSPAKSIFKLAMSLLLCWVVVAPALAEDRMAEDRRAAYSAYEHKNYKLAYILLHKLAQQGDVYANFNLGHLLVQGLGTPVDVGQAIEHYKFAVDNGVIEAANNLGVIYAQGIGGQASAELAVHYYKLAADRGNVRAQINLAELLQSGQGVMRDPATAADYYRKAAMQNESVAQYQLGVMYLKGEGVASDLVESYAWLSLADANGAIQARPKLKQLISRLNPAQHVQAKERLQALQHSVASVELQTP